MMVIDDYEWLMMVIDDYEWLMMMMMMMMMMMDVMIIPVIWNINTLGPTSYKFPISH